MVDTFYYDSKRHSLPAYQSDNARFKISIYKNPYEYDHDSVRYMSGGEGSSTSATSGSRTSATSGSRTSATSGNASLTSDWSISDYSFPLPLKGVWNRLAVSIRSSNFKICKGGIASSFFSEDTVNKASVIFMLYYLNKSRTKKIKETLIGFALVNDLRVDREDDDIDEGTLYIDAICTNPDVRNLPEGGIRGAGQLLMNSIEKYASEPFNEIDGEPFTNVKLSALTYVIPFYRKLGYRHAHNIRDLHRDLTRPVGQQVIEKDTDIIGAVDEMSRLQLRYKDDKILDTVLTMELAKDKNILVQGKLGEREKKEYLMSNLK